MFNTFFYEPIYNLVAVILSIVPLHDIGTAIVIVTLIVKLLLLPVNISALRTQYLMKKLDKEMKEIKELQKKEPQEAAKKMVEMYKREKINPFSSIFGMIIQIPVFFALYFVFAKGFIEEKDKLYSFVSFPENLHTIAFGIFDVTEKNIMVALLAGVSSYVLAKRQTETMNTTVIKGEESFQDHLMKSMKIQLLYIIPIVVAFSGAVLPSALALYWLVSNIVSYAQDVYVKNKLAHLKPATH
ncbi:MAG: YidC/Oxa1 family membrane protein insertase [Candidatus Pacebacteria bacterium]|jgi:YidC/Oxa1 family membrane protein insertase|nr:YidC/Oxa1 family membrane protein insertase [Candidatus Paceibacterota bacterium]